MNLKNCLAFATMLVFASSCGDNSTKETETTASDTVVTTTTVPVTQTIVVPDNVKTSFKAKYPTVSEANWSRYEPVSSFDWEWSGWPMMDTSDYMVKFNWDNTEHWAWFDSDNNWIGTVSTITDYAGLPAAVNKTIAAEFPGYTIVSVDKENDKNRTAYEVELTKGDDKMKALIAEDGSVMKKKGMSEGEKTKEKNM